MYLISEVGYEPATLKIFPRVHKGRIWLIVIATIVLKDISTLFLAHRA